MSDIEGVKGLSDDAESLSSDFLGDYDEIMKPCFR